MKNITLLNLSIFTVLLVQCASGQVGIGNSTPHENAVLDLKGSNKGLLLPEVSLPGSFILPGPSTGLIVWNTNGSFADGVGVYYNSGTDVAPSWVKLSTGGAGVTSVSASAPLSSTGGATPVISLTQANTSTNGYLSATDWNSFNNKLSTVSVNARLTGNGTSGNPLDLSNSGVTAGTYTKLTVDQYGRATVGASLAAADIPNLDASKITTGTFPLTRITAGTGGQILRTNGTTVEWWTPNYLTSFTETDPTWNGSANQTGAIGRTGNVGIGNTDPKTRFHVTQNAATMNLEGTDHAYIQWYPDGFAAGRKAYTGFPTGASNDWTIGNEISGGNIALSTTSGNVIANSLAGTGTRSVYATANGTLTTAPSVYPGEKYTVYVRRVNYAGNTWAGNFTNTDEYGLPFPNGNFGSGNVLNNGSPYSASGDPNNINPYYPRIDQDGWLGGGTNFALIYDFYIIFPAAGTHTFSMPRNAGNNSIVDDAGAFYAGSLNDGNPANMQQRLLYQQYEQAPTIATWTVTVAAGDMLRCRVYFKQGTGGANLRLLVGGSNINMSWVYNIK